MSRLAGDPGVLSWLRFAAGFRLPDKNLDWVRHELTDAGWRVRTVLRHLAVIIPICAVVAGTSCVLVSVIDCCTREIVGWNLSRRCRTEDALEANRTGRAFADARQS